MNGGIKIECIGSQNMVPRPAASISPENSVEMYILRPYTRLTESETQGVELSSLSFIKPTGDSDAC